MCIYIYIFLSLSLSQHAYCIVIICHYDWLLSTAETTASNSLFRNTSICAMKSVPGRTAQNKKLLYLYRKGDVIMKSVSFRSNSTIKDHDAPECAFICQWRRYLALNVFSRRTAGQHSQRSRHRSMLDLRSDCGKCSNVALTESKRRKNRCNRLHRTCSDLSCALSFLSITWPHSGAGSSHGASIHFKASSLGQRGKIFARSVNPCWLKFTR